MFVSLLLKNWKYVIIVGLLISLVGSGIYVKILKAQITNCEQEKKNVQDALSISQSSVKSLQLSINEQNAAIEKLKKDADERLKNNAAALAKAKQDANNQKIKADKLLQTQRNTAITACEDANNLFNSVLKK